MGLFDFFKKQKSDVEQYTQDNVNMNPYDTQSVMDSQDFRITVQDVFNITGRGTVITGQIESGSVRVGDNVVIQRLNGSRVNSVVGGIEQFRKMLDCANVGENVGILLRNVSKSDISKGDVITK